MFKPLNTRCWEKLLSSIGYQYERTKGSHDQWTKKGHRTIPVWGDEKQIPAFHISRAAKTIGWNMDDIYAWAAKNC